MATTAEIKRAKRELAKAHKRLNDLEEDWFAKVERPKLRKLIGKCYRYRNTYGSGKYWWLYIRITAEDQGTLNYVAIEKTCDGDVLVRTGQWFPTSLPSGYEPISESDYLAAVTPLLQEVVQQARASL